MKEKVFYSTIFALILFPWSSAQAEHFGALSYDTKKGSWGTAWDYPSQVSADERALTTCRAHGVDCQVYVRFQDGCGAFAVGARGGWGWGTETNKDLAKQIAIDSCSKTDQGCRVVVWGCNSTVLPEPPAKKKAATE